MSIAAWKIFQFPVNCSAKFVLLEASTIFSSLLWRCIFIDFLNFFSTNFQSIKENNSVDLVVLIEPVHMMT